MSKEITIDKLTIGNKLTSREVDSTDIFVDGISIKEALKKLPPNWVKTVNNILPDTNGNIQIDVGNKEYTAFEVFPTSVDMEEGTQSDIESGYTAWSNTAKYSIGNLVRDAAGNNLYIAIKVSDKSNPIEPGITEGWKVYWTRVERYEVVWSSTVDYAIGKFVRYNDKLYKAIAASTKTAPIEPGVTTGWQDYWKEVYDSPIKNNFLTYMNYVPAQMTFKTIVRSDGAKAWDGLLIDWGDGTKSTFDDKEAISGNKATFSHTYETQGKYIVKIYGDTVFGLMKYDAAGTYNLISRIWDNDLPISSQLHSWKEVLKGNLRLLKVQIPYAYKWPRANLGLYYCFSNCKNLIKFNSEAPTPLCQSMQNMFENCYSMVECKMEYENYGVWKSIDARCPCMFWNCYLLTTPPYALIPSRGWMCQQIHIESFFYNCKLLPALFVLSSQNISEVLWDLQNHGYHFWLGDTSKGYYPFAGCSAAVRELVPTTWGGTKPV